jgi:hypothetical protein
MKFSFQPPKFLIVILMSFLIFMQLGCTKDCPKPTTTFPIQGLWEGTYKVGAGAPVPAGTSFYFSFSVYPGGKVSYKSKGFYNGSSEYVTFADGTWSLNGTAFSFNVTTVNIAGGGTQHVQSGTAVYNSNDGTMTNGIINDPQGGSATWTMTRVN